MGENQEFSQQKKKKWGVLGGLGALMLALGGKLKFLLPVLKLLKLGKVGGTIWSMLLMVWAYTIIYPWQVSAGLVLMLFIHEMGHVWAAKRKGLPVSAPAFIPFLGALIVMKKQPQDAQTEAYMAFGGPILGSVGALVMLLLGFITAYEPFFVIAWIGFFLNLINMLPIHPLDGGRIVTAISRWLWLVGLIGGLIAIIFYLRSVLFFIIWAMFAWELYKAFVRDKKVKGHKESLYMYVSKQLFEDHYIPIPGREHRRQLDFVQYSLIEEKIPVVEVFYPGIGSIGQLPFDGGQINNVNLVGTNPTSNERVSLILEVTHSKDRSGHLVKDERYYQVPLKTRITYGIAYFGLAVILGVLMLISFHGVSLS